MIENSAGEKTTRVARNSPFEKETWTNLQRRGENILIGGSSMCKGLEVCTP